MRLYIIASALFSIAGVVTAVLSASALGPGMWGAAILLASLVVAASIFYRPLLPIARDVGGITAVLGGVALVLGLLAGSIGGSSSMAGDSAGILAGMGFLCIFGTMVRMSGRLPAKQRDTAMPADDDGSRR